MFNLAKGGAMIGYGTMGLWTMGVFGTQDRQWGGAPFSGHTSHLTRHRVRLFS